MKVLVIITTLSMDINSIQNIIILKYYMDQLKQICYTIDYGGISSFNDFENYENIINFKFKLVSPKKQLSKLCDFINIYKDNLNYDWYIKIRTEVKLLEQLQFCNLLKTSINVRTRVYKGPKKILYGSSKGGEGIWNHEKGFIYSDKEEEIIPDDHIYIFHHNIIELEGFKQTEPYTDIIEDEWFHKCQWDKYNIPINPIGINMDFTKFGHAYSGHLNIE